ncbi:Metalloenzyme, LuxS/M16 peptidase-like protein [Scheffersomyces xylosifermentans]|uniref:Metalloenzyme, LuxS/M16 peptidase-like protein n=1 Tax=Scheffersomyces xylosifermentans TaxID=1304137 RepID=UPI00315DA5A5
MGVFTRFFIVSVLLMFFSRGVLQFAKQTSFFSYIVSSKVPLLRHSSATSSNSKLTNPSNLQMLADKYTVWADDAQIEKPHTDDRSYRYFKLNSNDLQVLVIHDPTADKSAASLDVNVGSYTDKQYDIPGLAHFCEHLLFMGTEKYPEENEYSSFLAKHSGYSNAYTAAEHTNYYFQLSSDYLEGALDRFAQFFISPLFSQSCKDREINAVDSENKKNLQNDIWRLYQLDKSNSNPKHPYNGFSTGNYQTLHVDPTGKGLNVRDVLMDFHKSHYSSNLMSLVILGKEDLDTLSTWAIEKFSDVPNKSLPRPHYNGETILTNEYLGKLTKAKPIMDKHQLELTFMIPDDLEAAWKSKPNGYFSHLLGHESEGSVLYHLKHKGWVTGLSSGNMKVCQGSSFFMLEFELTPEGLAEWKSIVVTVFQYLKLILSDEPKQWIWEEMSNMSAINFKFRQKADASGTVSKMSSTLYKFADDGFIPPEYLLSSSIYREFNSSEIVQFGKYLNPDNFRIALISQSLDGLDKTEQWYGTEYSYDDIPFDLLTQIRAASLNENLHYPSPNDFIPKDFEVLRKKAEKPLIHPYLVEVNNKMHVWFKQDDQFEVPKGTIEIVFHLPNSNTDLRSSTYSALIAEMLNDELNQIVYYASLVGLKAHFAPWRDGFNLKVSGYNDKLPVLLEQVLSKFINFKPNKERFEAMKFKLYQQFKNFGFNVPYSQVGTHLLLLVNDKTYTYEEKIKLMDTSLTFNDLYEFTTKTVWDAGVFSEILIHGNFDITKADEIKKLVSSYTKNIDPIAETLDGVDEVIRLRNYILPENASIRYELPLQDSKNINSCIEYYIQISPESTDEKLRVLTDLLSTIIREPCFNQLRTKEQLGYVVFSGLRLGRTSLGFRILVQSERTTDYLEYRIDEFLTNFGKYVNNELTDEDFAKFKQALKDTKLAKLKHLSEETNRLWNYITDGYYDFESRLKHVNLLESISKDEFVHFFNDYIFNESKKAGKLVVHLKSQSAPVPSTLKLVQSSIVNYVYRNNYQVSSDKLEAIVESNYENHGELVKLVANEIKEDPSNKIPSNLEDNLLSTIKIEIESPVPAKYPSGKLYTQVSEFRSDFKLGGVPSPVEPLSKYYYPGRDPHL